MTAKTIESGPPKILSQKESKRLFQTVQQDLSKPWNTGITKEEAKYELESQHQEISVDSTHISQQYHRSIRISTKKSLTLDITPYFTTNPENFGINAQVVYECIGENGSPYFFWLENGEFTSATRDNPERPAGPQYNEPKAIRKLKRDQKAMNALEKLVKQYPSFKMALLELLPIKRKS